jgi:MFS family permease
MTDSERSGGAPSPPPVTGPTEQRIVLLVALVQFVNILDFMMVMPLGPYFADALHFPRSDVGYVGTAYTAAAGVSGVVGALFLDRFDRRRALLVAVLGLSRSTCRRCSARACSRASSEDRRRRSRSPSWRMWFLRSDAVERSGSSCRPSPSRPCSGCPSG